MSLVSVQNLNYQKPLAILLTFIFITNLVFGFVLLPTKEAKAVVQVIDIIQKVLQEAWKIIDEALQGLIEIASSISAAVDLWFEEDTLLSRIVRVAAYALLIQLLNMVTNDIINWIQGGGEPRFVSDWKGFLEGAASAAGGAFVEKYLGMGWLCEPFDFQIKIALLSVPKFEERVKCSLEDMGRNIENFYNDFTQGGWETWIKLTEPQNNFYGAYLISVDKMIEEEAKAKEAAKSETESGGGFLGHKMCTQCRVLDPETGNYITKSGLKDCDPENNPSGYFICDKEEIQTPPTVIQYEVQKAVDSTRSLMEQQIASLTPTLGIFEPYIVAIANALITQVIKEGLAAVGITGPSSENPDAPMPPGVPIITTGLELAQTIITFTPALIEYQKLLKENLENELLSQQQKNLAVLNDINDTQTQTLQTLRDVLAAGCSLPSWVTSETISTETTGITTTQIIKLTATDIGNITIKKTTIENELGSTTTYEIQEITPSANSQITTLEQDITSTEQWITDTSSSISYNNDSITKANNYIDLYTTNEATNEELDKAEEEMKIAYNLAISASQIAAKSQATDLSSLIEDTIATNLNVVQQVLNVVSARGTAEYPEAGTLYYQLQAVQSKLSQAQSAAQCQLSSPIRF